MTVVISTKRIPVFAIQKEIIFQRGSVYVSRINSKPIASPAPATGKIVKIDRPKISSSTDFAVSAQWPSQIVYIGIPYCPVANVIFATRGPSACIKKPDIKRASGAASRA